MERDVIVVSGMLSYKPVPNGKNNSMGSVKVLNISLYPDSDRFEASFRQIAQTQTEFVELLGEMFFRPIVFEAQLGEATPVILHLKRDIRSFIQSKEPVDDVTMNEILSLVTDQTSLQFTKARRVVPTLKLTQADK